MIKFLFAFLALNLLPYTTVYAAEIRGDLSLQGFLFVSNPAWQNQGDQSASVAANVEFFHDFHNNLSLTIEGFYRIDSQDNERSHGDLRMAEFLYYTDNFEIDRKSVV